MTVLLKGLQGRFPKRKTAVVSHAKRPSAEQQPYIVFVEAQIHAKRRSKLTAIGFFIAGLLIFGIYEQKYSHPIYSLFNPVDEQIH
ncbi:hypothetical protein [Geobacillus jurassicus]|uniref:Uncharacterized protein n=1 Tax=Geobacillus jurassicus TaxID=235932 RepID=A0ABV6GVW7_9BACL|nr:hypothetical protein [Geobacillus jurassicus]